MALTEAHVLRMLRISGYSDAEARSLVRDLTFPAPIEDVITVFSRLGLTRDSLIDRMGGSP